MTRMSRYQPMDERVERYYTQRIAARLHRHIDTQTIQAERKAKLRILLTVMVVSAVLVLAVILLQ